MGWVGLIYKQQEACPPPVRALVSLPMGLPGRWLRRLLYETILAQRGVGGVRRYRPASEGGGG